MRKSLQLRLAATPGCLPSSRTGLLRAKCHDSKTLPRTGPPNTLPHSPQAPGQLPRVSGEHGGWAQVWSPPPVGSVCDCIISARGSCSPWGPPSRVKPLRGSAEMPRLCHEDRHKQPGPDISSPLCSPGCPFFPRRRLGVLVWGRDRLPRLRGSTLLRV